MIVVTETLDGLNISRAYSISPSRVYKALDWLNANNSLYEDVRVDRFARLIIHDVISVIASHLPSSMVRPNLRSNPPTRGSYVAINTFSRIIRDSWNQIDQNIVQL